MTLNRPTKPVNKLAALGMGTTGTVAPMPTAASQLKPSGRPAAGGIPSLAKLPKLFGTAPNSGSHWLDSGSGGLTYDGGPPRPTGGGMLTPPKLAPGSVPGAWGRAAPALKPAAPAGQTAPTQQTAQQPNTVSNQGLPWSKILWDAAGHGLQAGSNYATGMSLASKLAPAAATAGTLSGVGQMLPAYGAYALGDFATAPLMAAAGVDNYQDLQQRGVHDSYASNVGSNLMRPGRAAFGLMGSAYGAATGGAREYLRGRNLDQQLAARNAPRPTGP